MMGFFACGDILSFHIGCLFSHCNTLQHTATHCNTLQRTATHCLYSLYSVAVCCNVKIKDNCVVNFHIYYLFYVCCLLTWVVFFHI